VNSPIKSVCQKSPDGGGRTSPVGRVGLAWLSLTVLVCSSPALAQSQQSLDGVSTASARSDTQRAGASFPQPLPKEQLPGSVSGTVVAPTGALLGGVQVRLTREDQSPAQESLSSDDGQFSFVNIAPGPFRLTVAAEGFATQVYSGILQPGEACSVPPITLSVTAPVTQVSVVVSRVEVAEEEIKEEEKQRALGFIPNFYVSYVPDALPLTTKQKFELAWKSSVDPVNFAIIGAFAGVQQAQNDFRGYGQGAQGYGKRYGAGFADSTIGAFVGGAALPSLLKQDPRYFYKGTGSIRSRILYALANAVICKSDKGRWQANYSGILGSLASGGFSNLYYPAKDRGAGLVFENASVGIGASAAVNLVQEFVVRKFTPNLPKRNPATP